MCECTVHQLQNSWDLELQVNIQDLSSKNSEKNYVITLELRLQERIQLEEAKSENFVNVDLEEELFLRFMIFSDIQKILRNKKPCEFKITCKWKKFET